MNRTKIAINPQMTVKYRTAIKGLLLYFRLCLRVMWNIPPCPFTSAFFLTQYYLIVFKRVTSGAGTAYPSGALEFTPCFSGVRVTQSLVLCVCFEDRCLSFCPFLLAIALSVLRFTDSDDPFGIFEPYQSQLPLKQSCANDVS